MEASMDEPILSMMRALLEAQERGQAYAHGIEPMDGNYAHVNHSGYGEGYNAWEPPCNHDFEGSSDYHGGFSAHENHSGYEAGYQSWESPSTHAFDSSSAYQGGLYAQENHRDYGAGYDTWEPTSYHGVEPTSDFQGELYAPAHQGGYEEGYQSWQPTHFTSFQPSSDYQGVHYAPEHQSGYEEAYPSWEMQYDHGETTSSTLFTSDDTYNMMKMLLEAQTRSIELFNSFDFGKPSLPPSTSAAATEHMESFTTDIHQWNDKPDSDCISLHDTRPGEIPPIDMGNSFEEIAPHTDEFLQEADWTVTEFEFLLGCTVDENLVLSYEDPVDHVVPLGYSLMRKVVCEDACPGGLVVDCLGHASERSTSDDNNVQSIPTMKPMTSHIEVASTTDQELPSPMRQTFAKHPGSLSSNETSIGHPWNLPFADIRMNEFRGWFYDEYDPGDPQFCRVHLDTSS